MLAKFSPILQRVLSIALILNGALLAVNWFKNTNPEKNETILIIAIANLALGLTVYVSGFLLRRRAQSDEGLD